MFPGEFPGEFHGGERSDRDQPAEGPRVQVRRPVDCGGFVRRAGEDVRAGALVLPAGTRLGPAQLGALAAVGRGSVRVRPRPRVAVLSTGSELVQPGQPVGPGQINDANSFILAAAAREAGALVHQVGGVPDDPDRFREVVETQLGRVDLLVTSGGVSVGAYDVVKQAFAGLGEVSFRRLRMRPGKPQGYGVIGTAGTPLFALPGNPVSAYVSFEVFVRPVIRALRGVTPVHRPVERARCTGELTSPPGVRQFARGRYTPGTGGTPGRVEPVGGAGSHLVGALGRADALIVLGEDTTSVTAGALVDVMPLERD
jgi:molybdopterin molybdotransferase